MRISDWSSDVCSSDLLQQGAALTTLAVVAQGAVDILERRQEVADEDELRAAWQRQRRRQVVGGRLPGLHQGGDLGEGGAAGRGPQTGAKQRDVPAAAHQPIGRASCRERVCQYV